MKINRLIVPVLMALVLMLCCGIAVAENGTHGQLAWSLNGAGTLVITGNGPMKSLPWDSTDAWLAHSDRIREIVIGNGITTVGNTVFAGCGQVTEVQLPDSVTAIGDGAFAFCKSLPGLVLPPHLESIGTEAFWDCGSLNGIVLPESLKTIGDSAFGLCASLESIRIPSGVKTLEYNAFIGCKNLTSVFFSEGLETIKPAAFGSCERLTGAALPNSLVTIGENAFGSCIRLTHVSLPAGLTDFSPMTFVGCDQLEEIFVAEGNPYFISLAGGVYSRDGKRVVTYPNAMKSVAIPEGVTTIGKMAFYGHASLTEITLPDTLITIEEMAFSGCAGLKKIDFPDSLRKIEYGAFSSCGGLTEVHFPEHLTETGNYLFQGCTGLTVVWLPNVPSLGTGTFRNCTSLRDVYYDGKLLDWCNKTSNPAIPSGVKIHMENTPTPEKLFVLPAELHRIDAEAFSGLSAGFGIVFPKELYSIAEDAFPDTDYTILFYGVTLSTVMWADAQQKPVILIVP